MPTPARATHTPGVYRVTTPHQDGYQAQIRRSMYDSKYGGNPAHSLSAAVEWYYTVRRLLDLPPTSRAAVHRSTRREAYVVSVSKWFNGGGKTEGEEGLRKAERAAIRWRKEAMRRIEEAGL